ncbi:unnamed protein product [Trifolium pratense]|uniref:Uncharacterized protein n=1 Tax=Trifolium pratense TaxID=57577 RepID=A0ACB0MFY8_TRIPR|nr:unnamed protein product [Trifolium pratense]
MNGPVTVELEGETNDSLEMENDLNSLENPARWYPILLVLEPARFHCNFKAKDSSSSSSIEEFFGEIHRVSGSDIVTTFQVIKDDEKHAGCEYCRDRINHPVDGYKKGRPDQYSGKMQASCTYTPPCIWKTYFSPSIEQFSGEIDKVNGSEPVVKTSIYQSSWSPFRA